MSLALRLARLGVRAPALARSYQSHTRAPPQPTAKIATAKDFLSAIGRSAEEKLKVDDWKELWKLNGRALRGMGLSIEDRRYIMWSMEKFRQGEHLDSFVHPEKPKKTVRGWGPAVQNGRRIRSRRKC